MFILIVFLHNLNISPSRARLCLLISTQSTVVQHQNASSGISISTTKKKAKTTKYQPSDDFTSASALSADLALCVDSNHPSMIPLSCSVTIPNSHVLGSSIGRLLGLVRRA
jgi:hypothetical protein